MPGCAKHSDPRIAGLLLAVVLTASACTAPAEETRFRIEGIDAQWSSGRLNVTCRQRLALSDEAREALVHGVPLTLDVEFILREAGTQSRVAKFNREYEIRYLPLSEHFQVTDIEGQGVRTYPRLRHALAWLSRLQLSFETGILPGGDYELLARSRLDMLQMPPPMRLPALLSSQWRHDSSWTAWPLEIHPGA
ncbi:MAG: DUF4390 domain-containing protein [Lysobacterales bacterium]|jgi:hypothetical protein